MRIGWIRGSELKRILKPNPLYFVMVDMGKYSGQLYSQLLSCVVYVLNIILDAHCCKLLSIGNAGHINMCAT